MSFTNNITLGGVSTLGMLVGTSGTDALISQINADLGNSQFFGSIPDILSKGREMFVSRVIEPIRAMGNMIKNINCGFGVEDRIIPITDTDYLSQIPSAMHLPILTYQPIRKLFDEGRIFGFGHVAIPEGDPYGRLIKNGYVTDVLESMNKDDEIDFEWCWESTDPELSEEELESIEETRNYLDHILKTTQGDPTDWGNNRG